MSHYFKDDYDPDSMPEETVPPEEQQLMEDDRRSRWIMTESLLNYLAVVVGVILIILFIALLFSIIKWLAGDISSTFSLLADRFNQTR
ncbi:MAG: hypothetical protein CW338_03655 [Clostridiales bacterium]|nr:hypothetical protein [Clostridiales bacterium]